MSREHGLSLLDSQLADIAAAVDAMRKQWAEDEVKSRPEIRAGGRYDCEQCGRSHPAGPCGNFTNLPRWQNR